MLRLDSALSDVLAHPEVLAAMMRMSHIGGFRLESVEEEPSDDPAMRIFSLCFGTRLSADGRRESPNRASIRDTTSRRRNGTTQVIDVSAPISTPSSTLVGPGDT